MSTKKRLSIFTFAMLNVAAVASLRGLPSNAELGMPLIFYLVLAAVVFFLPVSLVAAELATTWKGGVFTWVKEAFGDRMGFLAIWLQWIQNVIWYPLVLAFAAGAIAYIINPELAKSGTFTAIVLIVIYWLATFISFRGLNLTGLIGSWGVTIGTVIPGIIIIVLAIVFLGIGNKPAVPLNFGDIIPKDFWNLRTSVFAVGMLLAFAGMEMNAVHANEMENSQKNYPKTMFIAIISILVIFVLGSLAVMIVVPGKEIILTAGIMEAYEVFFKQFNILWAVPLMAFLLAIGAFAGVITWVAGPSKGILKVGKLGYLPPWMQHTNKQGVQSHILIVQGAIVTLLALAFIVIPDVSSSYWLLTTITIQLYLIMYLLMFSAALRLRKTKGDIPRPYRTPAMYLVAGIGFIASLASIFLGFVPPVQWKSDNPLGYIVILLCGMLILGVAPLIIYRFRKPGWVNRDEL